ncbi:MAG: Required for respiratory growth protein 9 mitochondrial [Pycnora praestabilis]|nr:MAG: Required for respiratory growth protein 9 mitochondrial [Pycnora praestabilis]
MLPTKIPYQDPTIFLDHAQYRSGFEEEPDVELREDISPGEKSNDLPATSAPISSNRNGSELSFADGFGGTEEGEDAILELNSENIEALATEGEVKGSDCTPKFEEPHSIPPSSQSKRQRLSLDRDSERVASKTSPKFKVASKKVPLQAFKHGDRETWQIQKSALLEKFGSQSWTPRKRLSPDALEGIRALNAQYPNKYTTPVLADQFKVSPDAIRRILKSKWRPNDEEEADRRHRWDKRGEKIWTQMVELGVKPPKKWREMGVGKSDQSQDSDRIKKPRTKARTSNVARKPWSVNEEGFQRMRSDEPLPMEESLAERIL